MPRHPADAPDHATMGNQDLRGERRNAGLVGFERRPLRRRQVVATERGDALGYGRRPLRIPTVNPA
jgi:hypothetical protein